jgi:hypothetical protein
MALYHAVRYMFTSRSRRRSLAPVLLLAFSGAFLVVTFGWAIKGLDLVLHDRIVPTTMRNVTQLTDYASDVRITAGCDDAKSLRCAVDMRAIEARSGGLNQSSDFRVYSHQDPDIGILSFIAPFDIPVHYTIGNAHTYAAHTACEAYHPQCDHSDDHIWECRVDPSYGTSNSSLYGPVQFNTTQLWWQMQIFLLERGSVDVPINRTPTNGVNVNPLPFVNFGCFDDYASIPYNDSDDAPFPTPFFNWWTRAANLFTIRPNKLCSIAYCNTTLFDATYSTSANGLTLDAGSLRLANQSATIALSGAALYLGAGQGNSLFYQFGKNYLDEMLQVDLSTVGNLYGNDTSAFAAAWGASISNRLLGWSAGTIDLQPGNGTVKAYNGVLALSIDLISAYAFVGIHFAFAGVIILLGASCAFIPRSTPLSPERPGPVSDIRVAHAKLSNFSTLMLEVLDAQDSGIQDTAHSSAVLSLQDLHAHSVERSARLGLRARENGAIGLDFHE